MPGAWDLIGPPALSAAVGLESDAEQRAAVAVRLGLQGTVHTDERVAEPGERGGVPAGDVERPGDE